MTRLLELVEGTDSRVKREVVPVRLAVRETTSHPPA
jgi:DNA-binding LacI/PurR family transcriptional regulator